MLIAIYIPFPYIAGTLTQRSARSSQKGRKTRMEQHSSYVAVPPEKGLDFLWLELTNQCNLQCHHCYAESGPYEPLTHGLQHDDWLAILEEAAKIECREVQFIGGEPLLYPRLHELIRFAHEQGYEHIEVFTNGTRLTERDIRFFREHGVALAFSYYSTDAATHDSLTQVQRSHQRTRRAIELAHLAQIPIRVSVIETSFNAGAYQEIMNELLALGIENIGLDFVRGVGRGACGRQPQLADLCGNCGVNRLAINSRGDVAGCIMSHPWNVGDISQGIWPILQGKRLQELRENIHSVRGDIRAECEPSDYCNPHGFCAPRRTRPCTPRCHPSLSCRPNTCRPDRCTPGNK